MTNESRTPAAQDGELILTMERIFELADEHSAGNAPSGNYLFRRMRVLDLATAIEKEVRAALAARSQNQGDEKKKASVSVGLLDDTSPHRCESLDSAPHSNASQAQPLPVSGAPKVQADLQPLPELESLADLAYAQDTPDDWDADYRSTWQKLQVAERNNMQWRVYAMELRALLAASGSAQQAQPSLPSFVIEKVEKAIHAAKNPVGQHTNGPCIAYIEVSCLERLLRATQPPVTPPDAPTPAPKGGA